MDVMRASLDLLAGLAESVYNIVALSGTWLWEVLLYVHFNAPRLEGLAVGIILTWVLTRRDKHPLLRIISAPLKLVVDILDLIWDQIVEMVEDLLGTIKGWIKGSYGWVKSKIVSGYEWVMNKLKGLKEKVKSITGKKEE